MYQDPFISAIQDKYIQCMGKRFLNAVFGEGYWVPDIIEMMPILPSHLATRTREEITQISAIFLTSAALAKKY